MSRVTEKLAEALEELVREVIDETDFDSKVEEIVNNMSDLIVHASDVRDLDDAISGYVDSMEISASQVNGLRTRIQEEITEATEERDWGEILTKALENEDFKKVFNQQVRKVLGLD